MNLCILKNTGEDKKAEGKRKAPVFAFGYAAARKGRKNEHPTSNTCLDIAFAKPDRMLNGNMVRWLLTVNLEPMNLEPGATRGASACAARATR
jgi:hypothetical protein